MNTEVHDALATTFDAYRFGEQLHDVPPHEVHELHVDGERAVCKFDVGPTGSAGVEGRVMALVDERAAVPVPEVLLVGDGFYLARWHPDAPAPDASGDASEDWAAAAGRCLATLHAETESHVEGFGRFVPCGEAVETVGHETWHEAVLAYVERHRPVPAANGHGDVVDRVREQFRRNPDAFAGAGDSVCCHGWATPEHVAVADDAVACVVDFEHAIAAPAEYDYWRTVFPTFGDDGGPDREGARRAFRESYESVRDLPADLDRRRDEYELLALVYYLESLYVQDQYGPAATAERASHLRTALEDRLDAYD